MKGTHSEPIDHPAHSAKNFGSWNSRMQAEGWPMRPRASGWGKGAKPARKDPVPQ